MYSYIAPPRCSSRCGRSACAQASSACGTSAARPRERAHELPHALPRLFGERRAEVDMRALHDATRGAAKPGSLSYPACASAAAAASRSCMRHAVPRRHPSPSRQARTDKRDRCLSEQPEQRTPCERNRRRLPVPSVLEQTTHSRIVPMFVNSLPCFGTVSIDWFQMPSTFCVSARRSAG